MATIDERSLGVARLYARSMLEVAEEQGASASLGEELDDLIGSAERDPELADFLSSPILERSRRRDSIESMLRGRASDLLVDSLQIINKKDRLGILPQIVEVYHEEHRELLGQIVVKVSTAVPLDDSMRDYVRQRTRETTGKDAHLVEVVDPELLGGLVVQAGDQKIDMSVRRDLELLSERFRDRMSSVMIFGDEFANEEDPGDEAPASQDAPASPDGREDV